MLPPVLLALVLSVCAGVMNGSFALPTKHIKTWNFENIWLNYAFWAFLVLPWLTIFVLDPNIGHIYSSMSMQTLFVLIVGGFLFGAGQVCFALALRNIGLGLGFVINIGLGTALGSLLPLLTLNSRELATPTGILTIISIAVILIGLVISYQAGDQRDKQRQISSSSIDGQPVKKNLYRLGVILAILAGLFSAGQNYTFALTSHMQQIALASGADSLAASIVIWPPFLLCSFIPYAIYMLYLHSKNNSLVNYHAPGSLRNGVLGIIMGVLWFGSLAIYSKASLLIGALGPVIAWPLFMVLIILTSNFWGWRHKEWENCSPAIKRRALLAVAALVLAVLLLAYGTHLSLTS